MPVERRQQLREVPLWSRTTPGLIPPVTDGSQGSVRSTLTNAGPNRGNQLMTKRFSVLAVSAAIVGGFFITAVPAHAATSADRGEVSLKAAVTCNTSQLRQQIAGLKTKAAKLKQLGRPRRPRRRSTTRPPSRRSSTRASRLTTTRASRSPDKFPVSMCGAARPVPWMGGATRMSGQLKPPRASRHLGSRISSVPGDACGALGRVASAPFKPKATLSPARCTVRTTSPLPVAGAGG